MPTKIYIELFMFSRQLKLLAVMVVPFSLHLFYSSTVHVFSLVLFSMVSGVT